MNVRARLALAAVAVLLCGEGVLSSGRGASAASAAAPDLVVAHSTETLGFRANRDGTASLTVGVGSDFPVAVDPAAIDVELRRIDGTLRTWHRLTTSSRPHAAAGTTFVFGPIPADLGATYEIAVDRSKALAPIGPAPSASDYARRAAAAPDVCWSGCATPGPARETVLLTVPSARVASPDVALSAARRAYTGRTATALANGLTLFVPAQSPHGSDRTERLARGQVIAIGEIARGDDLVTSAGPLGVPAAARLPAGIARHVLRGVDAEVLTGTPGATSAAGYLSFASPDEMRVSLRAGHVFVKGAPLPQPPDL